MLRVGTFICPPLVLLVPLLAHLNASEICPPPISTYDKCPNGFRQSWPIPPSYWIDTDTVVEQVATHLWEYHWCLNSSARVDDEIFFIWRDLGISKGRTSCSGFWGLALQSTSPPSDVTSDAAVGPELTPIRPQIQFPADRRSTPNWRQVLEYLTSIFISLPSDKVGDRFIDVGLTLRSSAIPVLNDDEQISTRYRIEYTDPLSSGVSSFQFSFGDDLVEMAQELDGLFSFSDKPLSLEFVKPGAPINVIGTVLLVNPDGYEVGSMPVSLALPSD